MIGFQWRRQVGGVALAVVLVSSVGEARAQGTVTELPPSGFRPRPVRQGTLSLGGVGHYGSLFGSSGFGDQFEAGLGLGFSVRYRTDAAAAFGLSFDAHDHEAKTAPVLAEDAEKLQIVVTSLDYYRFFRTRTRSPRYLVLGAGLAQTRRRDLDGERRFPGDGGALVFGAGVEHWLTRTLTVDLGVRYHGVLLRSEMSHVGLVGLGINFYTSP
jgi:opacity protein-like surface antigen